MGYGYEICTWNVRGLLKAGSLVAASKELSKCKLDFMGVQEFRCEGGGKKPAREYTLFQCMGIEKHELDTVIFVHRRIFST
jgi:hypothetical protein